MRLRLIILTSILCLAVGGFWWRWTPGVPVAGPEPFRHGPDDSKVVALVVNVDWGEECLPVILDICRRHDTKLTFFVTGRWAGKFPDLVRRMAAEGHEIGNHGFGYPHPDMLSVEQNLQDIRKAEAVIRGIIAQRTTLFAPPYGEHGPAVLQAAERAGYRTVLWSVDTVDWKFRNADTIIGRVVNRVHPGAIVLMHPLESTTKALPVIITELEKDGYRLVTVGRLLGGDSPPFSGASKVKRGTVLLFREYRDMVQPEGVSSIGANNADDASISEV